MLIMQFKFHRCVKTKLLCYFMVAIYVHTYDIQDFVSGADFSKGGPCTNEYTYNYA